MNDRKVRGHRYLLILLCLLTLTSAEREVLGQFSLKRPETAGILSKAVVLVGKPFRVFCNANLTSIEPEVKTIMSLQISYEAQGKRVHLVKFAPFQDKALEDHTPEDRNWEVKHGGGGSSEKEVNRQTIFLEIQVPKAKMEDAGRYLCQASYNRASGHVLETDEATLKVQEDDGQHNNGKTMVLSSSTAFFTMLLYLMREFIMFNLY